MRYLLDTCTFLYYLEGSNKLSSEALSVIESDNLIYLSQTSLWEIAIKKTINKLDITEMTSDLERICNDGIIKNMMKLKCYISFLIRNGGNIRST